MRANILFNKKVLIFIFLFIATNISFSQTSRDERTMKTPINNQYYKSLNFEFNLAFAAEQRPEYQSPAYISFMSFLGGFDVSKNSSIQISYNLYHLFEKKSSYIGTIKTVSERFKTQEAILLHYKYDLLNSNVDSRLFKNTSVSFGFGIAGLRFSMRNYAVLSFSFQKNITLFRPIKIPIGLKILWAPSTPNYTVFDNYKYLGFITGFQIN